MFRVLIVDDSYEDRELLKMEIERALSGCGEELRFYEAQSVSKAHELLKNRHFDLMTLDIEFDRLNEGMEALPDFFEEFPTLNIIIISGKLNKIEVTEQLFQFTKDNVLKGKRWVRHFDVLDKKDDKAEAIRTAFDFALKRREASEQLKDLFLLAESYMEKNEVDKCLDVYKQIQEITPDDADARENIQVFEGSHAAAEQARDYLRRGEKVIAALLLGHYIELRLKTFTKRLMGRSWPGLYDCLKELDHSPRFSQFKKDLFQQTLRLRNKAIHHPSTISEEDFDKVQENLRLLEAKF